jgi:alpha-amylase
MMGDDGEQFGAWPSTYAHCWGEGRWVDRFFDALEASRDWLTTVTPSAWLEREPPIGRVYVPTSSYAEMGEWALPPAESVGFSHALHRAQAEGRPEARWLRGAFWRNFQVRYREINDLQIEIDDRALKLLALQAPMATDLRLITSGFTGLKNCQADPTLPPTPCQEPDTRIANFNKLPNTSFQITGAKCL